MMLADFTTMQGYNCIFGNVYNTLRYFRTDFFEQDLFFWFSAFQGNISESSLFDTFYEEKGKNSWLNFVKQSLAAQQPVLVSVNPSVLPYIKYDAQNASLRHYINIIGIDVEKKKMCVSDSYVPTYSPSTYMGWVDYRLVSDFQIKNCWRIKISLLRYFQRECRNEEIRDFTFSNIIRRLSVFLKEDKVNHNHSGIDKLEKLHDIVFTNVENKNYEKIFELLAGIRLNIINPLIYLRFALERNRNRYQDLAKSLDTFTNNYWETLNLQLIKFAIAHKHLDSERISEQIKNTILEEEVVLNAILEKLISDRKMRQTEFGWMRKAWGVNDFF